MLEYCCHNLSRDSPPKNEISVIIMLQTCMSYFLLWDTKDDTCLPTIFKIYSVVFTYMMVNN